MLLPADLSGPLQRPNFPPSLGTARSLREKSREVQGFPGEARVSQAVLSSLRSPRHKAQAQEKDTGYPSPSLEPVPSTSISRPRNKASPAMRLMEDWSFNSPVISAGRSSKLCPTETMLRSYRAQDCEELRGVYPSRSQPGHTVESRAELSKNCQMPGHALESECR